MKAKRLVPGQIVNPHFSHSKRREAIEQGQPYDVVPFLNLPAGEIVDDPDCWKLCIGDETVMAPADEECRQAVLNALGSPRRKTFIDNLRRQNHPEVRKQMSKGQLEWLDSMLESFGKEVAELESGPAPARAAKAPSPTAQ